eukprot:g854.t1
MKTMRKLSSSFSSPLSSSSKSSNSNFGQYVRESMSSGLDFANAFAVCNVLETLVRKVCAKTRQRRRKACMQRAERFGEFGAFTKECCDVAMWTVDMVARFGGVISERKRAGMRRRLARKFDKDDGAKMTTEEAFEDIKLRRYNHIPSVGWHCEVVRRQSGFTAFRRLDVYYFTPTGHKLRSRPDVFAFLQLEPRHKKAYDAKSGASFALTADAFSFCGETMAQCTDIRLAVKWDISQFTTTTPMAAYDSAKSSNNRYFVRGDATIVSTNTSTSNDDNHSLGRRNVRAELCALRNRTGRLPFWQLASGYFGRFMKRCVSRGDRARARGDATIMSTNTSTSNDGNHSLRRRNVRVELSTLRNRAGRLPFWRQASGYFGSIIFFLQFLALDGNAFLENSIFIH